MRPEIWGQLALAILMLICVGVYGYVALRPHRPRRPIQAQPPIDEVKVLVAEALQPMTPLQLEAVDVFAQAHKHGWYWVQITPDRHPHLLAALGRGA